MAEKQSAGREALVETEAVSFFDRETGPFFRKVDWNAFWTTFIISLGAYWYTLAPTVTLEDSGELAVASDYLGVPHPPGYPIWSLLTWFFQWIFGWVRYNGNPNPAWGVGFSSAVFGAASCAVLAILISRSGADMLRSMKRATDVLGLKTEALICWVGGVTGGLLFAFSPVLWSQSVIVEVYSLNALFLSLIILLTYRWMCRPREDYLLYLTAFLFGLGFTNHQSIVFAGLGLAAAIWFRDRRLFRDCMAAGCLAIAGYLMWKASLLKGPLPDAALRQKQLTVMMSLVFLISPAGLFLIERRLFTEWKRVTIIVASLLLGLSFYAYLPFSSEQNPPINWGYPRTTEGFKHAFTRGQYEKIDPVANLKHAAQNPGHFLALLNTVIFNPRDFISVVAQFMWWISALVLLIPPFLRAIDRRARNWLAVTFLTFISLTVIFLIFQYPQLDVQTLFIGRVQYIQAHAVFALWIAYGLIFGLTWIETLAGGRGAAKYVGIVAVALIPLAPVLRNAYDDEYLKIVGGVEQNGHDFGWQFGNWQLQGEEGIRADFQHEMSPEEFEKEWAAYPTPGYPPPMGTNAIFYGGTDPGRFVPTYMIYCAKVRTDVYLITQNALADNTYMSVMRDLYGDTIWIPSQQDSNFAFQQYVEDVQAGRIPAGADVQFQDGRVSVQGVQGVMMINGILAKMIFEANKHKHPFYVEESYVIPWMYPYLEPHGLIMEINSEPLPGLSPEVVANDRKFWDWYAERLLKNPKFERDVVARKTFSKLRGAIAGIYAFRRMFDEAEYAFQQAIDLYPLSPEANFRLADVHMQQREFTNARMLIEKFLKLDPANTKVAEFLGQIQETEKADLRRVELEGVFASGQGELNAAMELADLYNKLRMDGPFQSLTMNILNDTNIPANYYLMVAKMYFDSKRMDLLAHALQRYLSRDAGDARIWVELAATQIMLQQLDRAFASLQQAIQLGGEQAREAVRKDNRFESVREHPQYKALVPALRTTLPMMKLPSNLPMF
ncbi:MAG: Tetratricopeptide repeat protein [Verrucomicrobia bacterium ADurb.Bin345]|nr:MAG: Tetratricopeptide repeat protein [Verrucomicrobia bacterium ADurb.Bin345]